ncbi:helix-turn-helix domain-containing protein [Paenibacillus sp. OK003]|uniref:winged helix-turn-helix transcriptional regulator n=1 Tax=Paenibacillus sp. OK003 TaxID=1884380 RepID=UPI000B89A3FC|nr:winged helix-turn-helix transcriptional regulator [Paenibacillus sp. OK003]
METTCEPIDGFEKEFIQRERELYSIAYTQNILYGRWKYLIIWFLKTQKRRHSEIKVFLNNISQGSLTKQLRELEADGVVKREVYPEVPMRVEYSLTTKGTLLLPIIELMGKTLTMIDRLGE